MQVKEFGNSHVKLEVLALHLEALKSEGIPTCRQTVWWIQCHIERHRSILKSRRPTNLTTSIENAMQRDDETTRF